MSSVSSIISPIYSLMKKDFWGFFRTPIAYIFIVSFVLSAIGLPWFIDDFLNSDEASMESFFRFIPWVYTLFIPAIGMRSWAEEKRTGTLELLLTFPCSAYQAVIAKFLAAWLFMSFALSLTFSYPLTLAYLGNPDWGPVISGYIASVLMGGSLLSICNLVSAFSQNQIVAFVLGVSICLTLTLSGMSLFNPLLQGLPTQWIDAIANFSFTTHFSTAKQGLITFADLTFFLSLIVYSLFINTLLIIRSD